jgi:hypothetical protein
MDLPSRSEPCKKKKTKISPPPLVFQFFLTTVWTKSRTHYALCSEKDEGAIYIKITVATGVGDATTPVAYEYHSSNGPMR